MPFVLPHSHPCQSCGEKVECGGTWEENYDGIPAVICAEFHRPGGGTNGDFLCDLCAEDRDARVGGDEDDA